MVSSILLFSDSGINFPRPLYLFVHLLYCSSYLSVYVLSSIIFHLAISLLLSSHLFVPPCPSVSIWPICCCPSTVVPICQFPSCHLSVSVLSSVSFYLAICLLLSGRLCSTLPLGFILPICYCPFTLVPICQFLSCHLSFAIYSHLSVFVLPSVRLSFFFTYLATFLLSISPSLLIQWFLNPISGIRNGKKNQDPG